MSQYNHPICTEEPAITVTNMLSQWSSVHAEKCQGNYTNQMASHTTILKRFRKDDYRHKRALTK